MRYSPAALTGVFPVSVGAAAPPALFMSPNDLPSMWGEQTPPILSVVPSRLIVSMLLAQNSGVPRHPCSDTYNLNMLNTEFVSVRDGG